LSNRRPTVAVGRAGRPHGLDGAFVVEQASGVPERFAVGATVLAAGEPARVVSSKRSGGRLVVRLDRPVERGTLLEIAQDALPPTEPDSYYVFRLIGLAVEEERGRPLGRVTDVVPGVANDVIELDSGLLLPFVEACVRDIDLDAGRIVVASGFADEESGRVAAHPQSGPGEGVWGNREVPQTRRNDEEPD
jgi:16S rRNA processing protein RimM